MKEDLFYFISRGKWRRARLYFEGLCIYYGNKTARKIDRIYLRIWPIIPAFWILTCITWGVLQFRHDYNLLENYAHLDALTSDYYTKWRTDGNPGQEPPKEIK
jgi:hypothetical protein